MKPRSSRHNGAILKKLVVFLRRVELFRLQLEQSKEEERLRCVGSFAIAEWNCGVWGNGLWGLGNRLLLANFCSLSKGH